MKKTLITLLAIFICAFTFAQGSGMNYTGAPNPNSGYVNITEINTGIGLGGTDIPGSKYCLGITNISSYQVTFKKGVFEKEIFQVGIGTGFYFYNEVSAIPLFLDGRFIWSGNRFEPYLFGQSGMLLDLENIGSDSRLFVSPGAGARYNLNDQVVLNLGAALTVQAPAGRHVARDSFLTFKLGMTFRPHGK